MQKEKADLDHTSKEVYRKIGRNVLFFQRLEYMIKYLIANGNIKGYISELHSIQEQQTATVYKQTMGQLTNQLFTSVYSDQNQVSKEPLELKEAYVSFSFRIDNDPDFYKARKEALASVVADRNELIHNLLHHINITSIEGCLEAERYLDEQREKHLPEFNLLEKTIDIYLKGRKELAEFLKTEEGRRQFKLSWLRESRLVTLIRNIANRAAQPDGWVFLDAVGRSLWQDAPEEMTILHKNYGCKNLKALILATELFDISEESTKKGGGPVVFRLKPEHKLQDAAEH